MFSAGYKTQPSAVSECVIVLELLIVLGAEGCFLGPAAGAKLEGSDPCETEQAA